MDAQPGKRSDEREKAVCVVGVLIGGRSRRMGRPKALLPHAEDGTLVEHVVRVAQAVADDVFLLGDFEELPAALVNLSRLPDARDDLGPLAGLCSLLQAAEDRWALLLACDMPNVSATLPARLLSHATDAVDAVAFARDNRSGLYHSCCALYHPRLLPAALDELERGGRSLQALLGRSRVAAIHPNHEDRVMLTNVNTPADYEQHNIPGRST